MIRVAFDGVVDMDRHDEVRGRLLSALQGRTSCASICLRSATSTRLA